MTGLLAQNANKYEISNVTGFLIKTVYAVDKMENKHLYGEKTVQKIIEYQEEILYLFFETKEAK